MKFSTEFNLGNIVTILVLVITFFSKSGKWFVSIDHKLDELADITKALKKDVSRNGQNSNAIRQFLDATTRILSAKYPDTYWPELKWRDQSGDDGD